MSYDVPWMKLWVADFFMDSRVQLMSNAALGLYFRLLGIEWREGPLSQDHAVLAGITHTTPTEFKKLWPEIEGMFTPDAGRLIQPRLERERSEALDLHEKRKLGGQKTAAQRWGTKA